MRTPSMFMRLARTARSYRYQGEHRPRLTSPVPVPAPDPSAGSRAAYRLAA